MVVHQHRMTPAATSKSDIVNCHLSHVLSSLTLFVFDIKNFDANELLKITQMKAD